VVHPHHSELIRRRNGSLEAEIFDRAGSRKKATSLSGVIAE
jgi:hypothetical protein